MQTAAAMIAGVGTDVVEVERVASRIDKEKGFREQVFSRAEIDYCEARRHKAEHYAARFAAKEAFLKAAGTGLLAGFDLYHLEIIHDISGKPYLRLNGTFKKIAEENQWKTLHVSMAHIKSIATAVVIIEK